MKSLFTIKENGEIFIVGSSCVHFYTERLKYILSNKLDLHLYVSFDGTKHYKSDVFLYDLVIEEMVKPSGELNMEIEKTNKIIRNFIEANFL